MDKMDTTRMSRGSYKSGSNDTLDKGHDRTDHAKDLRLVRFANAIEVFVRTPMRKLLRTLPERPSELGGDRKTFDLNVFVLESWRSATGRKTFNPKSFRAMESFSQYICSIDDILDTANHPSITNQFKEYRLDEKARRRISAFVRYVKEMRKEALLTDQEAKNIFRSAGSYRWQALAALVRFEKLQEPEIGEILKVKEETTGGMGAIIVEIISTAEKIPAEQKKLLTKAFSDSFMASQIADDMHDIHEDIEMKVPNIAVAVLQKYPLEFHALIDSEITSIASYRKLAPKSYAELMQIGQNYLSQIPSTPKNMQVLDAIPRIFCKLTQLTSRGN